MSDVNPLSDTNALHAAFLERSADNPEDRHALAAFLVLRLIAQVPQGFDDELRIQTDNALTYVRSLQPFDQEAALLERILQTLGRPHRTFDERLAWTPLSDLVRSYLSEVRLEEALEVLDTCAVVFNSNHDVAAELHILLGRTYRELTDFPAAERVYRVARHHAKKAMNPVLRIHSALGRGTMLRMSGDLPRSIRLLENTLRVATDLNHRDSVARASHDLAVSLMHAKRPGAADLIWAAFNNYGAENLRFRALNDLGEYLYNTRHYVSAQNAFEIVERRAESPELRQRSTNFLILVCAILGDRGGFDQRVTKLSGAVLSREGQVERLRRTGQGYALFGMHDEASDHLRQALVLADVFGLQEYVFDIEDEIDRVRWNLRAPMNAPEADQALRELADLHCALCP